MLEVSLNIHLKPSYDILLQGKFKEKYSISVAAFKIIDLFKLFVSRTVMVTNKWGRRKEPWQSASVKKVSVYTDFIPVVNITSDCNYLLFKFRP